MVNRALLMTFSIEINMLHECYHLHIKSMEAVTFLSERKTPNDFNRIKENKVMVRKSSKYSMMGF